MSNIIYDQITEVLNGKEVINRHSFFQLRYFLIGKEPTHQSKMWRCIRELEVRKQSIEAINLELLDIEDKKELLDIEKEKLERKKFEAVGLDKREAEVKLRRLSRKINAVEASVQGIQKRLKETQEEAAFILTAYKKLEELEPLKPFDDLASQMEFWNEKISQEIQLRTLQGLPCELEVMKTALALDDKMPVKQQLIKTLKDARKLMNEGNKHLISEPASINNNTEGKVDV